MTKARIFFLSLVASLTLASWEPPFIDCTAACQQALVGCLKGSEDTRPYTGCVDAFEQCAEDLVSICPYKAKNGIVSVELTDGNTGQVQTINIPTNGKGTVRINTH